VSASEGSASAALELMPSPLSSPSSVHSGDPPAPSSPAMIPEPPSPARKRRPWWVCTLSCDASQQMYPRSADGKVHVTLAAHGAMVRGWTAIPPGVEVKFYSQEHWGMWSSDARRIWHELVHFGKRSYEDAPAPYPAWGSYSESYNFEVWAAAASTGEDWQMGIYEHDALPRDGAIAPQRIPPTWQLQIPSSRRRACCYIKLEDALRQVHAHYPGKSVVVHCIMCRTSSLCMREAVLGTRGVH